MSRIPSGLYLILGQDSCGTRDLIYVAAEALDAGVRILQYRDKSVSRRDALTAAIALREVTRRAGALLIVNDEVDLAMAVGADGVHLGDEDFPPAAAHRLLGKTSIIGYSTHSLSDVQAANEMEIDYIGFGPVFESSTKQTRRALGLDLLREAISLSLHPVIAIGGVRVEDVPGVVRAGAHGFAVISGVLGGESITQAVQSYLRMTDPYPA